VGGDSSDGVRVRSCDSPVRLLGPAVAAISSDHLSRQVGVCEQRPVEITLGDGRVGECTPLFKSWDNIEENASQDSQVKGVKDTRAVGRVREVDSQAM